MLENNFRKLEMPAEDLDLDVVRVVHKEICQKVKVTPEESKIVFDSIKEDGAREKLEKLRKYYKFINYDYLENKNDQISLNN